MSSYEATKSSHDPEEPSNTSSDAAAKPSDDVGVPPKTPFNVGNIPYISAVHRPNNENYVFYYSTRGEILYLKGVGDVIAGYTEHAVKVGNRVIYGSNRALVAVQKEPKEILLYYIDGRAIVELVLDLASSTWKTSEHAIPTGGEWDVSASSGLWAVAGAGVVPATTPARLYFVSVNSPGQVTTATRSVSDWSSTVLGPQL